MSRVQSSSRLIWSAPLASVLAAAALVATPTHVSIQSADASRTPEWGGPVAASLHAGSFPRMGPSGESRIAAYRSELRVVRGGKSDLKMTRTARAAAPQNVARTGSVWKMQNIFSDQTSGYLPEVALVAPSQNNSNIPAAYDKFVAAPPAAPIIDGDPTIVATVGPLPGIAKPSATVVAYAAAEPEIEAPFEAVIRDGTQMNVQVPAIQPKTRPNSENIKDWMKKRKRSNFKTHSWMKNKLPRNTFSRKQQACLAQGIYFEARGEPVLGQAAVGQVILNRVKNPAYPKTVCGVVYQNKKWRNRCQFSFACDGIRDVVRSKRAWQEAQKVAKDISRGKISVPDVGDATHYHATYVAPKWAKKMKRTDKIGQHIFYRTYGGGWS